MTLDIDERPEWDQEQAESMLGKTVLVGLTYVDENDNVLSQVQRHGTITQVHETSGIGIDIADDSEIYWLPPHLEAFQPAEPGEYRLRSTGEVLIDPDFVSTWTIEKDDSEDTPETSDRGYEAPQ